MTRLFFARLAIYFCAVSIPVIHPAIVVPYDFSSWWLFFFLIPGEMCIAYFISPPKIRRKTGIIIAVLFLIFTSIIGTGISSRFFIYLLAGAGAYIFTLLVTRGREYSRPVIFLEQILIAVIYFRILGFSRSSEVTAVENAGYSQLILILIIISFLIHGIVLYRAGFPKEKERRRIAEYGIFSAVIIPLALVLAFALPYDFVDHSVVLNNLYPDKEPETIYPLDESKGWEDRNGGPGKNQRGADGNGDEAGENGQGVLQGVPADQWGSSPGRQGETGSSGSGGKQYAVMLVISETDPVYSAETYFSSFDPLLGFTPEGEETLNSLAFLRLLETWRNPELAYDHLRADAEILYLSTLEERTAAYQPFRVEPTVLKPEVFPFEYFSRTISRISVSSPREWKKVKIEDLLYYEGLDKYLSIDLPEETLQIFQNHLNRAVETGEGYFETIDAILKYFSGYQYELGFNDDVSVENMKQFLTISKSGDCTEFSNTAAILGRLAGVPSRVVTGYLASRDLQAPAHRQGVLQLQAMIPELQNYPPENIFLVTTAHHHSWVQYYIPKYGWVDFESTMYAIPPPPGFDPNSSDVVIPIIRDNRQFINSYTFPWRFILKVLIAAAAGVFVVLYGYRYGKLWYLRRICSSYSPRAVRAVYRLLLMKMGSRGFILKESHQTALEYAEIHPEIRDFAGIYTRLRYREHISREEAGVLWPALLKEYTRAMEALKSRENYPLVRIFSLRGLRY